ncbi:hypothetical protein CRYUN_Cryun34aG0066500 [Craigia yunnanensis]
MIAKDNSKMRINCLESATSPRSSRPSTLLRETLPCVPLYFNPMHEPMTLFGVVIGSSKTFSVR